MTLDEQIRVMCEAKAGWAIQLRTKGGNNWIDTTKPTWNFNDFDYRVKEEPQYVPFAFEDWEIMIDKIVKHKKKPIIEKLTSFFDDSVNAIFYNELLEEFTFLDGSPCGKLKQ